MSLTAASLQAQVISFVLLVTAAVLFVVPWMNRKAFSTYLVCG